MSLERDERDFWVVDEFEVALERGYICENAPGYWWVPSRGFSMKEGTHLFGDEFSALVVARQQARMTESRARLRVEGLTERMFQVLAGYAPDPDESEQAGKKK